MKSKVDKVLTEVLEKIKPSKKDLEFISYELSKFKEALEKNIKKNKIRAEIFIGGSYAKKTLIKKDKYDIDVFLRFDKKYGNKISELTEKLLNGIKDVQKIHGSRDYFRIFMDKNFLIELIPVMKITKASEVENITDLSYSHVKYINKKIKDNKILEDIKLAKAFCYANKCYGAESHIQGFSGYSLELLVNHYKGFIRFLKNIANSKQEKLIIDNEKQFKKPQEALLDLNGAKIQSPIILIDPTYKKRNASAALSKKTFEIFKKAAKNFLKNPSIKAFEIKQENIDKIRENAKKHKYQFILISAKTEKQEGAIAGSKLLKFYEHFCSEASKIFKTIEKGFIYNGEKTAKFFLVLNNKKEILLKGPEIKDKKNVIRFKKRHKKCFVKNNRIYAKDKNSLTGLDFFENWKNKNYKKIDEMSISEVNVIN